MGVPRNLAEPLGRARKMIQILKYTGLGVIGIIALLYALPVLVFVLFISYLTAIVLVFTLLSKISPTKYGKDRIADIAIQHLSKIDGRTIGRWINALQRDLLPKLVGGERIANLLIESSRNYANHVILEFKNGAKEARNT